MSADGITMHISMNRDAERSSYLCPTSDLSKLKTQKNIPVLIYDGDCLFCSTCVRYWKKAVGERLNAVPSGEAASRFKEIPEADFDVSIQWIDAEGRRHRGARAIFRAMAESNTCGGKILCSLYARIPLFRFLTEKTYGFVAKRRCFFSRVLRKFMKEG